LKDHYHGHNSHPQININIHNSHPSNKYKYTQQSPSNKYKYTHVFTYSAHIFFFTFGKLEFFTKLCPSAAMLGHAVRWTGMTKLNSYFFCTFPKVTKMLQLQLSLICDCTTTINEGYEVMSP